MKTYLQLARFPIALILPLFAITMSYLVISQGVFDIDIFIPIIAGVLGTAGMCAMNDYFDVEADKVGASERPLPSGKIALHDGLSYAIILTIAGMVVAGISEHQLLPVIGGMAVILGLLYNWKTKGRGIWGTFTFGLIMVTVVLLGMVQAKMGGIKSIHLLFLIYVFFIAAANQSTATFYDFKSDKIYGYRTLPNIYGLKNAAIIVTLFRYLGLTFLLLFLWQNKSLLWKLGLPLLLLALIPLIASHFLMQANQTPRAQIAFRLGMVWTVLSFCTILWAIF